MMDQLMHVLTDQFLFAVISEHLDTAGVTEGTSPLIINSVNSFSRRIENQPQFLPALIQFMIGLVQFFRPHANVLLKIFNESLHF